MDLTITHDEAAQRLVCVVEGHQCTVEYESKGTVMDVFRTFVHPALRGRGIGERLMVATIDHARKHGRTIFPSCSYALRFFQQHPEHREVLAANADLEGGGSCRIG